MISPGCPTCPFRFNCKLIIFCQWGGYVTEKYRLKIRNMKGGYYLHDVVREHKLRQLPCVKVVCFPVRKEQRTRKNRNQKFVKYMRIRMAYRPAINTLKN